jgi:outer membrane protein TolC
VKVKAGAGLALLLAAAGCYQPRPLDARSVLNEVAADPLPAGGKATERGAAPGAVSEEEAVAVALKSNPDLRAIRRQKGVAEGEVTLAGALNNPTVDLDFIHLEDYGSRRGWAVALGWEPPMPGIYSAQRAAAKAGAAAVDFEIAEAEWQVAVQVRASHATMLALAEKHTLVDQALVGRRKIATLVDKRVQGGASTLIDLSLAQLAVEQLERERDDLGAQEIAAAAQLGFLMGTPAPTGATGRLPSDNGDTLALDPLVEAALASRPALAAAERRYAQREENVRLETNRRWPWFRFTAIPRYRADASDVHPRDYAFGLQLTVPILNWNSGGIQVAEATRDQERELFRRRIVDLRGTLQRARETLELRGQTLRRYETSVLPSLDQQEKLLATASQGGQLDVVALLAAADVILRSRRDYVDVRLASYRARLDLESAVGSRAAGPR